MNDVLTITALPEEKDDQISDMRVTERMKEQEPCDTCGYEEGSIYCKEHCPHEANIEQEPTNTKLMLMEANINGYAQGLKDSSKVEQEPCEDAISRQAVLDLIADYDLSMGQVVKGIHALPPVTPRPKTGRWIAYEVRLPDRTILNYRCSVCGRKLIGYTTETLSEAPFCHCGAKMVEPQERSDKE